MEKAIIVSAKTRLVAEGAKRIYEERLRSALEPEYPDRFVAIEFEAGDHFMAPARVSHALRRGTRQPSHRGRVVVTGQLPNPVDLYPIDTARGLK